MEPTWQEITKGSNWKHRKTGRLCIVNRAPAYRSDVIELLHQSGRLSAKQVHYFLYDFEKVKPTNVELTGSWQVHRPESSDRRERG